MPLTDTQIRQAKQQDKEWKLSDGGGLYLLVRPNGSKLWKHKLRINGREQKLPERCQGIVNVAAPDAIASAI